MVISMIWSCGSVVRYRH